MDQGFRFEPMAAHQDRVIARPRVAVILAGRFEHRLTTMVAPAGCGKSTAMTQAIRSNLLDPLGLDIWLGTVPGDSDPLSLLSGLLQACGLDATGELEIDLTALCEAIWRRAPSRSTLMIDDVHNLGEASGALLDRLLKELPQNGQLLLSGRELPTLTLGRLRVQHLLLEITEQDLSLDDDELAALGLARGQTDVSKLSRHAASADLRLTAGPTAAAEFLWEEVLGNLKPSRLAALCRASLLDEIDDELALVLSNDEYTADELAAGLPMVEIHQNGSLRFHAILRESLESRIEPEAADEALNLAARVWRQRGHFSIACELYTRANNPMAAITAAREFITLPTVRTHLDTTRSLVRSISLLAKTSALLQLLEAFCHINLPGAEATAMFAAAAETARNEGDEMVEAVAVFRALHASHFAGLKLDLRYTDRMIELAPTVPYAAGIAAHVRSMTLQYEGDSEGALAELNGYVAFGEETLVVMRAERLCDLGRPEEVGAELTPEDLSTLPPGAEIYIAFAMWLRGELAPELALPVAKSMVPATLARRITLTSLSMLSVASFIAIAAGELDLARQFHSRCIELSQQQNDHHANLFGSMAGAAIASANGNDNQAAAMLDPDETNVPLNRWPSRSHLLGLSLVYLLRPESRSALDRMSFGSSLTTAVAAGRALVDLREKANPKLAAALPWHQDTILRVHVQPHHLAELAVAASSEGVDAAAQLLDRLPNARLGILQASQSKRRSVASWACTYLESVPSIPDTPLRIRALGVIELYKGDEPVTAPDWARRARVQELLGLLVERRTITREEAATALWPDLDPKKSALNLRVSLSRLQSAIEPERGRSDAPAYILTTPTSLILRDIVEVDVDEFGDLIDEAQIVDRGGAPIEAMGLYEKALRLARGQYLANIDATWLSITRLRFDSLVRTTTVRLAELQLAGGEPEKALYWAAAAQVANATDERAGRLMILAMLSTGDRSGAVTAGKSLISALGEANLAPEAETLRTIERLGLTEP